MMRKVILAVLAMVLLSGFAAALEPPTNIDIQKISESGNYASVGIWWDRVTNATGYNLYKSNDNQTFYLMYSDISTTTITISLPLNHTYYFYLTAKNDTNESAPSSRFWINTTTGETNVEHYVPPPGNCNNTLNESIPQPVIDTMTKTTYGGDLAVQLHIYADQDYALYVYRSDDGGQTFKLSPVYGAGANDEYTVYDNNSLSENQEYLYYVRLEASDCTISYRSEIWYINMTTGESGKLKKLMAPQLLFISQVEHNGKPAVLLGWSDAPYAVRYEVYRSTSLVGNYILLNETYYKKDGHWEMLDTYNIEENKTYYYYIVAIGPDGERSYRSNILWINVKTGKTGIISVGGLVGFFAIEQNQWFTYLIVAIVVGVIAYEFMKSKYRRWRK